MILLIFSHPFFNLLLIPWPIKLLLFHAFSYLVQTKVAIIIFLSMIILLAVRDAKDTKSSNIKMLVINMCPYVRFKQGYGGNDSVISK